MDKEKEQKHDIGYSEKALDIAIDQPKGFDPQKGSSSLQQKKKKKGRVILDSQPQ